MHEASIAVILVGALIIALAIPLIRRKVKRNIWYGYRISIYVFEDDEIWYRVNETGGKHLASIGVWMIVWGFVAQIAGEDAQNITYPIMVAGMLTGLIASMVYTIRLAHHLAREKGLRK
jgi:hypothetical protein